MSATWDVKRYGHSALIDVVKSEYVRVVGGSYVFFNEGPDIPVAIHSAREYYVKRRS